jgi:GDP-4-dehydro-6-deoxy-D-mannose reductase
MREVLQTAIQLSGVKVKIRSAPHLMRPSDEKIIFGSTAKFRKHTGWKPTLSLGQTLASMLEYWERVI